MKKNPIFIVGMNGSGTTMLADCLNKHPIIYIPAHESKIIPYYASIVDRYGNLNVQKNFERLLSDFSNSHIFRKLNNGHQVTIPYDFNQIAHKNLANVIDLTFSYFASRNNKLIWGDHSPKYAISLATLIDLFPNAKVIHLVRDGRDCALSFNRRFGQNLYRSIYQWKILVKRAATVGKQLGRERYFELKYESLTRDPELYLRRVFMFLKLPFDPVVLKSNMPMYSGRADPNMLGKIVANSMKWKTAFSDIQLKKMELLAGKTLAEFGYEIKHIKGDKSLSKESLILYKFMDKLNAAIVYWNNYNGANKLRMFSQIVKDALKQDFYYRH